jgi:hypothetical protein
MVNINFNVDEDVRQLNFLPEQEKEIKLLLNTYLDEMNYWKTKYKVLSKKIQNIVCE